MAFRTSRTSTVRGRPPRFAGRINGATSNHSASVRSLSYRRPRRSAAARWSGFHMRHLSPTQVPHKESQPIPETQLLSGWALISAPPSRVWQVLTDFSAFPAWNPFIRSISGPLREDARLSVQIMPPGRSSMRFRPTVLVSRPNEELRWRGSLLIPGLFSGEHSFLLRPEEVNSTQFVQGERFSGLLVGPFVRRGMLDATRQGFHAMNIALKEHAENQTA